MTEPEPADGPYAEVLIAAPIDQVWAVLSDPASYPEWADFIESFEAPTQLQVGDRIVLRVRWDNGRTSRSVEQITACDPPEDGRARLDYAYRGWPARLGLVRTQRWQTLAAEGAGTRYVTTMRLTGPLVRLAGPDRIQKGFTRQAAALRRRCEG